MAVKKLVSGVSLAFLSFVFPIAFEAAPGDLDLTFGNGGIAINQFSPISVLYSIAIQPDGKIVAGGLDSGSLLLVKYNSDGTLDSSFGSGGRIISTIASAANDIALQPDGKIVVATYFNGDFAVVRFNVDGTPDETFGNAGVITVDVSTSDIALALAIQADGKIVIAGNSCGATNDALTCDILLIRINANGTLDKSFGSGGKTLLGDPGVADLGNSIAIQANGRIVLGGGSGTYYAGAVHPHFMVARFLNNGSIDRSFGSGGKVTIDTLGNTSEVHSILLQSDGKILAAGNATVPFDSVTLARYNGDGSLDPSFGDAGLVITQIQGGGGSANAAVILGNGKIVTAGWIIRDFGIIRYNPDGTLDQTFGSGGLVRTHVNGTNSDYLYAVAIQPDGKIVGAGVTWTFPIWQNTAVVRYLNFSSATISGRVFTDTGRGLSNAFVTLNDSSGMRRVPTNPFGFYRFPNVTTSQTVTIQASSKLYHFDSQTVEVNGDLTGIDFHGTF